MALATDTAHQLRFRLNDVPRRAADTFVGDGTASAFQLGTLPGGIVSGQGGFAPSAFIPIGSTAWSATGATFSANGMLIFSGVISANSSLQAVYWHGTFGEEEISFITGQYTNLNEAHLAGVEILMMDATKRASWAGGGVSYNESQTFANLEKMRAVLWGKITDEAGPQGGFDSWSENQDKY